ncbi:lipase member H-B-like [Leguminivora glycinivorella]|uniref:lipase member H-B-like n=1 Tax=Leguminivora glycinivorella TaxID=1035111 RepID=UPI002010A0BD|nr:lipase member H-B-like [Leguminivora glycinivorella]
MIVVACVCVLAMGAGAAGASVDINEEDLIPKLRFYFSGVNHYSELPLETAERILSTAWYNESRTNVIFVHGFTGKPTGPAVRAVITAFLDRKDCNVALLNWEMLAAAVVPSLADSYLKWAAPNARKLGRRLGDALARLAVSGLRLDRTQLVGHSLGAHVLGLAGNAMRELGMPLQWITALDPAGVGFKGKPETGRLHPGSATVVVAVHTDPHKYGFRRALGTVDFWPNYKPGNVRQPGCPEKTGQRFSPEDLCSHNRAWELFAEAVERPGTIIGTLAKNYREWNFYTTNQRNASTLDLDAFGKAIIPGNYYFITIGEPPYGLGDDGV